MSNLNYFHRKIDKNISLVGAYTEIESLPFIIKSCRLKPLDVCKGEEIKVKLYREWIDEHHNTLVLNKKIVKIIYNDLQIDDRHIVCTDLYYGFSIDKVLKISKLGFFFFGKEETNLAYVSFLGIDNYLRSFIYLDNEWTQISPLYMGMSVLKDIYKYLDIKYFLKINVKKIAIPCDSGTGWLTYLPMSQEFNKILDQQPIKISQYLQGK